MTARSVCVGIAHIIGSDRDSSSSQSSARCVWLSLRGRHELTDSSVHPNCKQDTGGFGIEVVVKEMVDQTVGLLGILPAHIHLPSRMVNQPECSGG